MKEIGNENNLKLKNNANFINKILSGIQNMNKNSININFVFSSGEKFRIKCNPYIKIKELIVYLLESLINNNNKFTINELKEKLCFLYNEEKIDINSSMQLDKKGLHDGNTIVVVNPTNLNFYRKNNIQEEIKSEEFNDYDYQNLQLETKNFENFDP